MRAPRLYTLSLSFYRVLLYLYPAGHRRAYASAMAQVFGDLYRDAERRGGARALAKLWMRVLWDVCSSAAHEHLDVVKRVGLFGVRNCACVPLSWAQVGLALLPGLFAVYASGMRSIDDQMPRVGLGICLLLGLVGSVRERRLTAWSLVTLGVLISSIVAEAFLIFGPIEFLAVIAYVIWQRRRGVHIPRAAWVLMACMSTGLLARTWDWELDLALWNMAAVMGVMLGIIALGLPLARRYGLVSGLVPVGASFILWEVTLDLTYCIWKTPWGITMVAILAAGLLIVSPLWVLRARSIRGQVWGLLLPPFVAILCVTGINALVRTEVMLLDRVVDFPALYPGQSMVHGCGAHSGQNPIPALIDGVLNSVSLFLGLAVAVVLYSSAREHTHSAPDAQTDETPLGREPTPIAS